MHLAEFFELGLTKARDLLGTMEKAGLLEFFDSTTI